MSKEQTTAISKEMNVQEQIKMALEVIDGRLSKLADLSNTRYKVSQQFNWSPTYRGDGINLQRANLNVVREITGFLLSKKEKSAEADVFLEIQNMEVPVPQWMGASIDDWLHDCKLRVRFILHNDEKRRLEDRKAQLEARLDEETKNQILLGDISKELGIEF